MRYTIVVTAAQVLLVQPIISKLPSHYVKVWQKVDKEGVTQYAEETKGAVEVMQPVGQLATLTLVPSEEETKWYQKAPPVYYILSGDFNDAQLARLKAAMVATRLVKAVAYWDGKEPEVVRAMVSAKVMVE
jgi:hypothetical protein